MKRSAFGAALLVFLLAAGLFTTWAVSRCHGPVIRDLEQGAQAALREDWEQTDALVRSAGAQWRRWWRFSAAIADHGPMESIDGLFSQLEVYTRARDPAAAAAVCAELARQVEAIGDAHRLDWWNLL